MTRSLLKNLLLGFASLLLILASSGLTLASGGDDVLFKKEVDGLTVELSFGPEHAKTGNNPLIVKLHNVKGEPVSNSQVRVMVSMPMNANKPTSTSSHSTSDMGSKADPLKMELKAGREAGEYEGEVNFSNEGEWLVKVSLANAGQQKEVDFTVDVDAVQSRPNWAILGGFVGVIVAVVVAAGVMKRKSAASQKSAETL